MQKSVPLGLAAVIVMCALSCQIRSVPSQNGQAQDTARGSADEPEPASGSEPAQDAASAQAASENQHASTELEQATGPASAHSTDGGGGGITSQNGNTSAMGASAANNLINMDGGSDSTQENTGTNDISDNSPTSPLSGPSDAGVGPSVSSSNPGDGDSDQNPTEPVDYTGQWTFDEDNDRFEIGQRVPPDLNASMVHVSGEGSPDPGALELQIEFDDDSQALELSREVDGLNLTGRTVYAQVRLLSGLSSDSGFPGTARLWISTGQTYGIALGPTLELIPGEDWMLLSLNVDAPSEISTEGVYAPDDVRELGVTVFGPPLSSVAEAAVLQVDTIGF